MELKPGTRVKIDMTGSVIGASLHPYHGAIGTVIQEDRYYSDIWLIALDPHARYFSERWLVPLAKRCVMNDI